MIRRLNEIMLALLSHASLPSDLWVEALHTATYLHNILPTTLLQNRSPTSALYLKHPTYDHLRVFGCACFPNANATRPHKLAPRSSMCVFLGYPAHYRGYRRLDLSTGKVILSCHVTFDESYFSFSTPSPTPPDYSFLDPSPAILHPCSFFPPSTAQLSPTPLPTASSPSTSSSLSTSYPSASSTSDPSSTSPSPSQSSASPTAPSPPTTTAPHSPNPPYPPTAPPPPPTPTSTSTSFHPMITRAKAGISKPRIPLNLHTTTTPPISPIPTSPSQALADPNWNLAMKTEFDALMRNQTWELVPRPSEAPIIRCMWLFKHKYHSDGKLERYKARLVVNGSTQQVGIDCDETFSPVVKPATIRTVLSLAVSNSWPIHQLDVKNAFLHGDLQETVYMFQPPGFVDKM